MRETEKKECKRNSNQFNTQTHLVARINIATDVVTVPVVLRVQGAPILAGGEAIAAAHLACPAGHVIFTHSGVVGTHGRAKVVVAVRCIGLETTRGHVTEAVAVGVKVIDQRAVEQLRIGGW